MSAKIYNLGGEEHDPRKDTDVAKDVYHLIESLDEEGTYAVKQITILVTSDGNIKFSHSGMSSIPEVIGILEMVKLEDLLS